MGSRLPVKSANSFLSELALDDWEWMVTLWGRNPEYLREIVYKMRFDKASAKYAEFGPFYVGYRAGAQEILDHCQLL